MSIAALEIVAMEPWHAAAIEAQASQAQTLGLTVEMDEDYGRHLIDNPGEAWCAIEGGRVVALFGLIEVFVARQATAWAVLSGEIGRHHLAITRFCAERIRASGYARIEAIVECGDAEQLLARFPDLTPGELLELLNFSSFATPGTRWARACGLRPATVLRRYGAASETHMLFERIG